MQYREYLPVRFLFYILFSLLLPVCGRGQGSIITTIAGNDTAGYGGDGGHATNAKLWLPQMICFDKTGNIIFADCFNHRVRKINITTHIITTIAGTGVAGYNGDNIPATDAQLKVPQAVFVDTLGDIYITDGLNNRIRKINVTTGNINTVAGNGTAGNFGDGGLATNAQLSIPVGMHVDKIGNLYIGDYSNNKIRKVDVSSGIITTIAGIGSIGYTGGFVGYSGDYGPATNAEFSGIADVFVNNNGDVIVCDQWNHVIRKIDAITGIITTIAGNGISGYSGDNGAATNAQLNQPTGTFVDNQNNIFFAEWGNGSIRKIDNHTGIITTVAGTGIRGYTGDGGVATSAELRCSDVCVDILGTIYIADYNNNRIRKVYNPQLAINTPAQSIEDIRLYPNPTRNEITTTATREIKNVEVINMLGQTITLPPSAPSLKTGKDREVFLSVAHLPAGIYFVKVNGVYAGKFVKE